MPKQNRELISTIANTLAADVKAYNLPALCERLGLACGDDAEAYKSKAKYVQKRLLGLPSDELGRIAVQVNDEYPSDCLQCLLEKEQLVLALPISPLTRQKILASISMLPRLEGTLDLISFLEKQFDLRASLLFHDSAVASRFSMR